MEVFDRVSRTAFILNITAAISVALCANIIFFLLAPNLSFGDDSNAEASSYYIPDWLVGTVWVALFAGLGAARWMAFVSPSSSGQAVSRQLVFLTLLCAVYPIYTGLLPSFAVALSGNVVTALAATYVARQSYRCSGGASFFAAMVALWLVIASYSIIGQRLE